MTAAGFRLRHLDDDVERRLRVRQRVLRACQLAQHQLQAGAVEKLERAQRAPQALFRETHRRDGGAETRRAGERDVGRDRPRGRDEGDLRDHAERSLRPDEQLLQVVPGVVLAQSPQKVQHAAVREHDFQTEHRASQRPVSHEPQPAGVGADVAADLALPLRAEVQGDGQTVRVHSALQVLEHDASLGDHHPGAPVHGRHGAHVSQVDDHLVVHGDAPADQTRVPSLGDHGQTPGVAAREHAGYLPRGARQEQNLGPAAVLLHPVLVRGRERTRVDADFARRRREGCLVVARARTLQDLAEKRHVLVRERREIPAGGEVHAAHGDACAPRDADCGRRGPATPRWTP